MMGVKLTKDGESYVLPSKTLARNYLHVSSSTMDFAVKNCSPVHGFIIEYMDTDSDEDDNLDNLPELGSDFDSRRAAVQGRKSIVATSQSGLMVKFKSSVEAANAAGCGKSTIKNAIHRHGRAGGWLWETFDSELHGKAVNYDVSMKLDFKFKFTDQSLRKEKYSKKAKADGKVLKSGRDGAQSEEEAEAWAKAGCTTREEYRLYLRRCLGSEFGPVFKEDDYD